MTAERSDLLMRAISITRYDGGVVYGGDVKT